VPTVIAFIACARHPFRLNVPRVIIDIIASTFGTKYKQIQYRYRDMDLSRATPNF
jgi:hypothetical protein